MSTREQSKPHGGWAVLRDTLLGRPSATGAGTVLVQLLLIAAWYPTTYVVWPALLDPLIAPTVEFWDELGLHGVSTFGVLFNLTMGYVPRFARWTAAEWTLGPIGLGLLGAIGYAVFRVMVRKSPMPLRHFVRSWWRSCLWGLGWVPVALLLFGSLPALGTHWVFTSAALLYLIVAPAVIGRRETARRRPPRWRPLCPECGYSLRHLIIARCPECGYEWPPHRHGCRRWAQPRLPWDRADRGVLLTAYVRTLLRTVLDPAGAARGAVLPDRLPRAVRWAAVQLALVAVLLAAARTMGGWLTDCRVAQLIPGVYIPPADTPWWVIALWIAQAGLGEFASLGLLPALGIGLGCAIPGRHAVAKRGIAKWSLYATGVAFMTAMACVIGAAVSASRSAWLPGAGGDRWYQAAHVLSQLGRVPVTLVASAYALAWAAGAAANPFLRQRGLHVFFLNIVLFIFAWRLVREVLFAPGVLEGLL